MKILFISHYFAPEGNAPASRVHEMTKRWVADGHEVMVLTGAPNVPNGVVYEGYKNRLIQQEVIDGVKVVRVWSYIAPNKGTLRRIVNFVSFMVMATFFGLFQKRPDMVIATSPQFFCGWAGVLVSKLRRLPFTLEIRDIWPESIVAVGANLGPRLIKVLEWLELKMYKAADHIVTVGEGYRRKLVEKGVKPEKIGIVTNGVDKDVYLPQDDDEEIRRELGLGDDFVCAYAGTIGMACGLDVVLKAARQLQKEGVPNIKFLMVGDGAVREKLEQESKELGLENVIFTGRRPKADMPRVLAASDACLVHLRRTDLFKTVYPSKIFEAAAMKRPVILGVEGSAAELVQDSGGGICIEPENHEHLLDAVKQLHRDSALRQQLGEAGHRYVMANFDRDDLAKDYLQTMEEILKAG
jgi:glycosyltransferase involved in cell wall biosynthesis